MAKDLANSVYNLTRKQPFCKDVSLVNEIRRASVSMFSNIAEGYERGSRVELVQFLFIAKGSCGEVRAQLSFAFNQGYVGREDYDKLYDNCAHLSAMLSNFIYDIRKKEYKGEKFR